VPVHFFPNPPFAWLAYLSLVSLCLLTAIVDWKRLRIPNQLTLTILGSGLVMNLVRGVWLGTEGEPGRYFGWTGLLGGFVEGLCFSLAGFFVGLAIFFVMWQLGTCGGGDVKLMAAVGAWTGPLWFLYILLGTYVAVVTIMLVWWTLAFLKVVAARRAISYAPPALLSVVLVMLWVWRHDLLATAF
jgi:prepilin peptidase CpaA